MSLNNLSSAGGAIAGYLSRNLAMNTSFGLSGPNIAKHAVSQFVQAVPFGAGYSFGTYVGFPKNYSHNGLNRETTINLSMPYYRRNYYGRYRRRRYGYRSYRRWY